MVSGNSMSKECSLCSSGVAKFMVKSCGSVPLSLEQMIPEPVCDGCHSKLQTRAYQEDVFEFRVVEEL